MAQPTNTGTPKGTAGPLIPQEFIDLLEWAEAAYFKIPNTRRFNRPVIERARAYIDGRLQEQFRKNLAASAADLAEKLKPFEDGEKLSHP